jgi:hypothetical protein
MVRYAIKNYGVSSDLVFMTGTSSGAMMTNVLAGAYPDLFKGGAAFAGVPYGCFAGSGMWNSQCATGTLSKTAQQWVREIPLYHMYILTIIREIKFELVMLATQALALNCNSGTELSEPV